MSLVGSLPVHLQGFCGWLIFVRSWIYFFGSHFGFFLSMLSILGSIRFRSRAVPFNSQIGLYQALLFRARVDLGAMAMKGYSTFPKTLALLTLHYKSVLSIISRTLVEGVLSLFRDAVGIFYSLRQLGHCKCILVQLITHSCMDPYVLHEDSTEKERKKIDSNEISL